MRVSQNKRKAHNSTESWHILLIEDQTSMAKMAAKLIRERWQCRVTVAKNYQQAKKLLQTKADAFFMTVADLNLPDAPNGEIIRLLNEYQQTTIAITGHFDQSLHETMMETGVIDYVLKKNINAYQYLVDFVGRLYHNSKTTVMVIDDSDSLRQRTATFLEMQFLTVLHAKNGEEGLKLLKERPDIKLVLVDAVMPVMDGLTFTAKARQLKGQNTLTIIGISGSDNEDLSTQFLKNGANDFISKPFSYGELTCRVNQNLTLLDYIDEINTTANIDFLTKLPNRRYFFEKGEDLFEQAQANQSATIVGILDIDHFKQFNDQYGHECGDTVLEATGELMQKVLASQHCARMGGEEFGFIITTSGLKAAQALVSKLHKAIGKQTVKYKDQTLSVSTSIGYTAQLQNSLDETLLVADKHLYAAKMNGRNRIISDDEYDQKAAEAV